MQLVLASRGFTTPEIAAAAAQLANKPLEALNVAVINEAYVAIAAARRQGWPINELSLIAEYCGAVAFVNLRHTTFRKSKSVSNLPT